MDLWILNIYYVFGNRNIVEGCWIWLFLGIKYFGICFINLLGIDIFYNVIVLIIKLVVFCDFLVVLLWWWGC